MRFKILAALRDGGRTALVALTALISATFFLACSDNISPTGPDSREGIRPTEQHSASPRSPAGRPGNVTDLSASGTGAHSVTLQWTQVDDGNGDPADYQIRYALTPVGDGWDQATVTTTGTCASPVEGSEVAAPLSCTVEGLDRATSYDFQLVAFQTRKNGNRKYSRDLSNVATGVTAETTSGVPTTVTDLSVDTSSDSSATLSWTDVDDGSGAPASYEVRYALTPLGWGWGTATVVQSGECASPIRGSAVGSTVSCTVAGLDAGTSYDFQLISFRDEADGTRVYSDDLSNVATGVTAEAESAAYSSEPTDFSPLVETTYASPSEGGFYSSTNDNFAIVDDASAPRSASKVARATFPAGLGDGVSPVWSEAAISSHSASRIYLSFWVRISQNWQGHDAGVNKVAIAWTHQKPVAVANMLGSDDGRLGSEIRIQDVPDGARNLAPNVSDPEIVRGRWHRWEIVLVSNTGDAADGQIHWWIDGTKAGAYNDVRFGTSAQSKIWDYVTWRPVWGGRGDVIEQTQYMWMDHYYVSGAH